MSDSKSNTAPPAQSKRLAREARKLALECADGIAPPFGVLALERFGVPCCVLGHLFHRATGSTDWPRWVDDRGPLYAAALEAVIANNTASNEERHGAVVFPLLALVDAIEDTPRGAK